MGGGRYTITAAERTAKRNKHVHLVYEKRARELQKTGSDYTAEPRQLKFDNQKVIDKHH